jgi:hypothetical protein
MNAVILCKMKTYKIVGILIVFLIFTSVACTQDEGLGGNSHIKGKIEVNYYNDEGVLLSDAVVPAGDEDVYLIFGNDSVIGEKTTTSNSGNFEYQYLWPGSYKLYYYSDDITGISDKKVAVEKEITLAKGETLILDDLKKNKVLKWNEGTSSIKGTIMVINYKNSSSYPNLVIKDITPAQDQDIYITYGKHPFYDERIRTAGDGTFVFQNLIKGDYKIFLYSENKAGATAMDVIETKMTITKNMVNDSISVDNDKDGFAESDTIYIDKL